MTTQSKRALYNKTYYDKHSDEIKKQKSREYKKNKEVLIERSLDYYYDNKEKLNRKIICECSGKYVYRAKQQHFKSKLHQTYLNGVNAGRKIKNKSENESSSDSETESSSDSDSS
jgi:hypothetical protein